MIKKTNPIMFRITKAHKNRAKSSWHVQEKLIASTLLEDYRIRQYIKKHPACSNIEDVVICRKGDRIQVVIQAAQAGHIIGRQGVEIEGIRSGLKNLIGSENIWVEVEEVDNPNLCANIIAKSIAKQIEKRARAASIMREVGKNIMKSGAVGYKIRISGRHGGVDIARVEKRQEGSVSTQTLRTDIRFAKANANTVYGVIGVKIWISRGDYAVESVNNPVKSTNKFSDSK